MFEALVGVNTLTSVDTFVYSSHCEFWYEMGRNQTERFIFLTPRRTSIDRMRNMCAQVAMEAECKYLMFIDDDVQVPRNAYEQLKKTMEEEKASVVAGVTHVRGYPYNPMIFSWDKKYAEDGWQMADYMDHVNERGNVKCDAVGFSCVLINLEQLKHLSPPYFLTNTNHTEDVYYCKKVSSVFPENAIFANTEVQTKHLLGPEFIAKENIDFWKKAYEEENEDEDETNEDRTRGNNYHTEVESVLRGKQD
jgi:hypothetical protein